MKRISAHTTLPLLLPLMAAFMISWVPPAHAEGTLGQPLIKNGDIAVAFIGADALYSNDVYYFMSVGDVTTATFLFNNHAAASGTTADPDDSALNPGDEAIFGICVNRSGASPGPGCENADDIFYSGSGAHNVDGLAHTVVWTRADYDAEFGPLDPTLFPADYSYVVGFEDILGGGDRDFNDAVFAIRGLTVAPEPLSMTLLATGLIGIGGAGMVRRKTAGRLDG
jgi:hypothetical protein